MSLSLTERIASLFRKQPPQEGQLRNSEIINSANSAIGQAEQTVIKPIVIRIEQGTPPVVLDGSGQVIPLEPRQKYAKLLPESSIINPGRDSGWVRGRHLIETPSVLPSREHPIPKLKKGPAG